MIRLRNSPAAIPSHRVSRIVGQPPIASTRVCGCVATDASNLGSSETAGEIIAGVTTGAGTVRSTVVVSVGISIRAAGSSHSAYATREPNRRRTGSRSNSASTIRALVAINVSSSQSVMT
jgi:hypothetical protein